MRSLATSVAALAVAATLSAGLIGCKSQTEGDKTAMQADQMQNAAQMIKEGEAEKRDAAAMKARGQTMKDQGNQTDGDQMISQAMTKDKAAQAKIDQGMKMKDMAKN